LAVVIFYMLGLFMMGFLVHPVAMVYVTLVGSIVGGLLRVRWRSFRFYSPPVFFGSGYLTFADWIHRRRVEKAHWEWELFNHYLYVGLAFNVLVGAFLTWLVTGRDPWAALGLGITVAAATSYSLARSVVIQQVYEFYSERAEKEVAHGEKSPSEIQPAGGIDKD